VFTFPFGVVLEKVIMLKAFRTILLFVFYMFAADRVKQSLRYDNLAATENLFIGYNEIIYL